VFLKLRVHKKPPVDRRATVRGETTGALLKHSDNSRHVPNISLRLIIQAIPRHQCCLVFSIVSVAVGHSSSGRPVLRTLGQLRWWASWRPRMLPSGKHEVQRSRLAIFCLVYGSI
jgi:hypothetical protein